MATQCFTLQAIVTDLPFSFPVFCSSTPCSIKYLLNVCHLVSIVLGSEEADEPGKVSAYRNLRVSWEETDVSSGWREAW